MASEEPLAQTESALAEVGSNERGARAGSGEPTGLEEQLAGRALVATLPPRVRRTLLEVAAEALGALTETEVPIGLRRIRSFAPARRARAAAAPLALALERDPVFRLLVAAAWRSGNSELAASLEDDELAPALDPELAAVGLYLSRPAGWESRLGRHLAMIAAAEQAGERRDRAEADREAAAALRITVARATEEAAAAVVVRADLEEELSKLRREHRRLRADADRARAATREAERRAEQETERLTEALAERDELVRQFEHEILQLREQLAFARQSTRDDRSLVAVRTRLLLDTIVDSASALRRELALPPAARTPADLVAEQLSASEQAPAVVPARGRAGDDPQFLAEVLRLPRAHLLVDGYNVTMEGFGGLPLVDQRRLLVDGLSALATRTSAEITCCFDGAEVEGRTQGLVRGVRVLFSDPGTTADDLIARLVRAEPPGRVVVVVSTDGEVVASTVAAGARSFGSTVLLCLLGSGLRDRKR